MSTNKHLYEYMDEASINSDLMCSICNKPFFQAVSTPCDHTFCRECLERWIMKNSRTCPTCRHHIQSIDQCTQVSRPLRNILDRLPIKCLTCGQTELQRDNFTDHIEKICLKVQISCSAADIKCSWSGLREELSTHLTMCKFEPLRGELTQLISENRQLNSEKQQLSEQIKQHNIQINETTNKLLTLNTNQPLLEKMIENESDTMIDLSHRKITDRDLAIVIQQTINKHCTIVQLQGNAITSQGIIILADTLLNNVTTLKDLWLSNNCISDIGVQKLTQAFLHQNSTLRHLHLGSNCITDRGVQYLVEILKSNGTLTDLWLYDNQITDQGVHYLASMLKSDNRTLKHLDLQWNKLMTDCSANSFVTMLQRNRTIERLNLRKCNISIAGRMQLLQAIEGRQEFKLIM